MQTNDGHMRESDLKRRTQAFGLRAIKLDSALPRNRAADVLGKQLVRCATSVGSNYRADCRARSGADFVSKISIVEEEADEALYWLELVVQAGLMKPQRVSELMKEGNEIVAIMVASLKTARGHLRTNPKSKIQNPKSRGTNVP